MTEVMHGVQSFDLPTENQEPVCTGHQHIPLNPILIGLAMNDITAIGVKRSG